MKIAAQQPSSLVFAANMRVARETVHHRGMAGRYWRRQLPAAWWTVVVPAVSAAADSPEAAGLTLGVRVEEEVDWMVGDGERSLLSIKGM